MGRIVSLGPLVAFVPLAARAVAVGGAEGFYPRISPSSSPARRFAASSLFGGGVVLAVAQMGIYTTCCMFHTDGARRPAGSPWGAQA